MQLIAVVKSLHVYVGYYRCDELDTRGKYNDLIGYNSVIKSIC